MRSRHGLPRPGSSPRRGAVDWRARCLLVVAFLAVTASLVAQQSLSQEKLAGFAAAYLEVRVLRAQVDREVDAVIGRSEPSRERLSVIADAGTENLPDDEARAYRDVRESIEAAEQRFRRRAIDAIRQAGLSPDRFTEINRALNADPDLAERARAQIERIVANRADAVGIEVDRDDRAE